MCGMSPHRISIRITKCRIGIRPSKRMDHPFGVFRNIKKRVSPIGRSLSRRSSHGEPRRMVFHAPSSNARPRMRHWSICRNVRIGEIKDRVGFRDQRLISTPTCASVEVRRIPIGIGTVRRFSRTPDSCLAFTGSENSDRSARPRLRYVARSILQATTGTSTQSRTRRIPSNAVRTPDARHRSAESRSQGSRGASHRWLRHSPSFLFQNDFDAPVLSPSFVGRI